MAIYVLGDLHLSLGGAKPMDIFSGWQDYVNRIKANWERLILPEDTIVLAGDISWAMRLNECSTDFEFIEQLPGQKIIIKGNHDYWWSTMRKMETFCEEKGFKTIRFMQNNCYLREEFALCGSRSWFFDIEDPQDEKVHNRELLRLEVSLSQAGDHEKLVFLHYPPIFQEQVAEDVIELLHKYHVNECYYGHLHGKSAVVAYNGIFEGISFRLISADALSFCPLRVK